MLEGLILLIILLVLIFTGIPVALAMALSGILGLLVFGGSGLFIEAGRTIWGATFSWLLVSVPFFLVMAEFMSKGRLAERMFAGLSKVTAGVRGSLAMAVVVGCTLFGLTTGGGITEVAAIGRISIPEMRKRGYDIRLTLGSIAASGALGFLVPPSIFLIIYGAWANLSVAKLFAGGLIPGFVMAVFLMASVAIQLRLTECGLIPAQICIWHSGTSLAKDQSATGSLARSPISRPPGVRSQGQTEE